MRDRGETYEYLTIYSDDIIVASKEPVKVFEEFKEVYTLKGKGPPEHFLGAAISRVKGPFNKKGSTSTLSAKTFLQNTIPKFEKLFGEPFRSYTVPMSPDYHPELDESPLVNADDHSKYRSLLGSGQWAITLGCIDIQYATTMFARFSMSPREGHLIALKKMWGYLKGHMKGQI